MRCLIVTKARGLKTLSMVFFHFPPHFYYAACIAHNSLQSKQFAKVWPLVARVKINFAMPLLIT